MPFQDHIEALARQHPKRSFVQHAIDRPGLIILIGRHLSCGEQYSCLVHSISCAGAIINISPNVQLPKSFFLTLDGSRQEIGATEFKREGETMSIRFNMFLDADYVRALTKGHEEAEILI